MKNFVFLILFLFTGLFSYSFETVSIPDENYNPMMNYQLKPTSKISNQEFEEIEKKVFKKTFKNDSSQKRLSRLEKEIFGMEQKGEEEERFENILTAYDYYEDKPASQNNAYVYDYDYSKLEHPEQYFQNIEPPKKSKVQRFIDDVKETFSDGYMSGYTPPIYYNSYSPTLSRTYFPSPNYYGYKYLPPHTRYFPPRRLHNQYRNTPHYPGALGRRFNSGIRTRIIN